MSDHESSHRLYGWPAPARAAARRALRLAGAVLVLESRQAARQYFAPLTPRFVAVLAFAIAMTGCSYTNLGEILKAAGQDPATVNVSVKSIYGSIQYCRTAILNGNVTCDSNGISVKSEAANVGVPMTITPQLSIGAPTLTQPPPAKAAPPTVIPQSAPAKPMLWLDPPDIIRAILRDAPQ